MKRHSNLLWLLALVLGWLLDFLFWRQKPGLNFALYAVLCLGAGFAILRLEGRRIAIGAVLLIPLIVFFAATTFVRAEPMTVAIAVILTLFLMALLAITFMDGDWLRYSVLDHITGMLRLGLSVIVRPLLFNNEVQKERAESGLPSRRFNPWPVVRGIVIALPVLLVFGALLASADVVFGKELAQFIQLLRLENLPEYVFRLIYIMIAAYALVGVFLHASGYGRSPRDATSGSTPRLTFLGSVESAILLGSVILLFGAFVLVQFRYFFGGQTNIGVEGFTYSEYARRGFGELLVVAFFSLLLLTGLAAVTRRETEMQRKLFSGFGAMMVALVIVMLVSAFQRLALYEAAYGFSRLRTYTHVLLIWIGVLLVAVAVLDVLRRERYFAAAALIAAVGFGITLSLLNVDAFIVRQNVERALRGEALDTAYLSSLSTDSVPLIAEIYKADSYAPDIHQAMGAVLACRLGATRPPEALGWRSYSLSRAEADASTTGLESTLSDYRYVDEEWPPHVVAPGGTVYDCQGSFAD